MAVGDVVSALASGAAHLHFQPAAGVEVLITNVGTNNGQIRMLNGVQDAFFQHCGDSVEASATNTNCKVFVTNSVYLNVWKDGSGNDIGYTGIQIK